MTITAFYARADKSTIVATLQPGDVLGDESVVKAYTRPAYTEPAYTQPSYSVGFNIIPEHEVPAVDYPAVEIPDGPEKTLFISVRDDNPTWVALKALADAGTVTIGDYTPPPAPFINEISDRQFFQQLALDGDITQDEALAAVTTGAIPAALEAVISSLPAAAQFNAKMLISGATKFDYDNPLTAVLAQAMNRTPDQMKAIWTKAAAL